MRERPTQPRENNAGITPPVPDSSQVREYSKQSPEFTKRRQEIAKWLKELRVIQQQNPEEARKYRPPAELIEEFYSEVAKEYKEIPLAKEEIERLFSPEHLSSLSLQEYVALLRKVPPRFITHVTRQGVRDNISFHDSGLGEFHHGFEGILDTKEVRSILERYLEGVITKDSVRNVLENVLKIPAQYGTRDEALREINHFLNSSFLNTVRSRVADTSALHAAMDMVADTFYGGERGNEIFFIYPTAFVASQCYLAHQGLGFNEGLTLSEEAKNSQFNDYWIKLKQTSKGSLPIDAAIVFIREDAPVDAKTGSQYEVDLEGKPLWNTEQVAKLVTAIQAPELQRQWRETLQAARSSKEPLLELGSFIEIAKGIGVTDERFFALFQSEDYFRIQDLINFIEHVLEGGNTDPQSERTEMYLRGMGIQFKLASQAISSREYWEGYFNDKGYRPSKIIYYKEQSPNEALKTFRKEAGLSDDLHRDVDLRSMFQDNLMTNTEMHNQMAPERDLFVQYAEELVDEYYQAA